MLVSCQNCHSLSQSYRADSALTCQVLQNSSHVHGCPHSNPVLGVAFLDVPQHPPHREDNTCLGRPGGFGGLLLPSPARHGGGPGAGSVSTLRRHKGHHQDHWRQRIPPFTLHAGPWKKQVLPAQATACSCQALQAPLTYSTRTQRPLKREWLSLSHFIP